MGRGVALVVAAVVASARGFAPPPRRLAARCVARSAAYEGDDPFAVLGCAPGASKAELRKAFRRKALKTHPDVNDSPEAAAEFARVQAAYDTASDPKRLRDWERRKRRGGAGGAGAART